jgi:hypothetical protein
MDRPGTCITLDKKYNIANSSCHFGSYGNIWTGPYTAIWPSVPWTICYIDVSKEGYWRKWAWEAIQHYTKTQIKVQERHMYCCSILHSHGSILNNEHNSLHEINVKCGIYFILIYMWKNGNRMWAPDISISFR